MDIAERRVDEGKHDRTIENGSWDILFFSTNKNRFFLICNKARVIFKKWPTYIYIYKENTWIYQSGNWKMAAMKVQYKTNIEIFYPLAQIFISNKSLVK